MKLLFISRVRYGTMASGATNWFPGLVAKAGNTVKLIECLDGADTSDPIDKTPFELDVETVKSNRLFDHLDLIFNVADSFCPDVIYIYGRPDLYEFTYHIRHRYPKIKIVIDIRSPLLAKDVERIKVAQDNFDKLQYYTDHIFTCDLASLGTYTSTIIKPVTVLPIGIDLSSIQTAVRLNSIKKIRRFIFVGSISVKRRIGVLVENFIKFSWSCDYNVSLDIYGIGNDFGKVSKIIESYSAEKVVRMKGFVSQQMLFNLICNYDAGIAYVPHELYSVAPSLKSLEYSAAGIPVLASDTLGHQRYCQDHGFKFKLFSNRKNDFFTSFKDACAHGIPSGDIESNLHAVCVFDWNRIVEERLLPVLEKMVH
jgi:glycosyltransferase involved in cell wall biosynthesis